MQTIKPTIPTWAISRPQQHEQQLEKFKRDLFYYQLNQYFNPKTVKKIKVLNNDA